MEGLIALQHRLLYSVSWQLQLEISEQNVFWVRAALVEYIKDVWKVPIRLGMIIFSFY